MKNLIFGIMASIVFSITTNAQEKTDLTLKSEFKSASVKTIFRKESTEYKFGSIEEFNEGTDQILNDTDFNKEMADDQSEITIEFTVSMTIGAAIFTMTGSITTTYTQIVTEAKRLKNMLITVAIS
jgi:hypothetical protein